MAIPFLNNADFNKNQILNAVIQNLASAPSSPVAGQIYYNTTTNKVEYYNGSSWIDVTNTYIPTSEKAAANGVASLNGSSKVVQDPANAVVTPAASKIPLADGSNKLDNGWLKTGAGNGIDADLVDGQHGSYYLARGNHTGTQTASTISDFDTQVRTSRLDQMAAPTSAVSLNNQRITSLGPPSADSDAATKAYADAIASGLSYKDPVRVATTANITLSSAPASIDGVTLANGERVLVKDQSTASENGLYLFNGSGSAMTRTTDFDTSGEAKPGSAVWVNEGTTNSDTGWALTTNAPITLDTTSLTFTQYTGAGGITAGAGLSKTGNTLDVNVDGVTLEIVSDALQIKSPYRAKTHAATVGDGAATQIDVAHNLGTRDLLALIWENSGSYNRVECDMGKPDTNTLRLNFTVAPASNAYRVIIMAIG